MFVRYNMCYVRVLYNTCVVLPAVYSCNMLRCIHMYLTILVSFDCVDTKIGDRRIVQCQCNKTHIILYKYMYIILYKCNKVPHI